MLFKETALRIDVVDEPPPHNEEGVAEAGVGTDMEFTVIVKEVLIALAHGFTYDSA